MDVMLISASPEKLIGDSSIVWTNSPSLIVAVQTYYKSITASVNFVIFKLYFVIIGSIIFIVPSSTGYFIVIVCSSVFAVKAGFGSITMCFLIGESARTTKSSNIAHNARNRSKITHPLPNYIHDRQLSRGISYLFISKY